MNPYAADSSKVSHQVKCCLQRWCLADHLHDHVRAPTLRHFLDACYHSLLVSLKVERLSAELPGQLQATVDTVNGKKMARLAMGSSQDSTETDWPTSDDDQGGLTDVLRRAHLDCALDTKVTGREDVSHEKESLIGNSVWGLDHSSICQWDSHILGLSAIKIFATK